MTKAELIELINSWENIEFLQKEIAIHSPYYKILIDIAFNDTDEKSWRAAYIVDKINDTHPTLLQPFLPEMIDRVKSEKSESKKRHFLKLISMNKLPKGKQAYLFDFCIDTFTSAKSPIAVRVHAMQILFNITEEEPDLKPEVLVLIENEMENHSTAGIVSRGKKLVRKLQKQIG